MRAVTLALTTGVCALCACATGFERNGDDIEDPRVDAPFNSGGDGSIVDARVDAPGTLTDAPMQTDAPTTGGVTCPDTAEYNNRALIEVLFNPNYVVCPNGGSDCSSSQCCYALTVCVAYP